ncbi:ice-binding family protein [Microbacterium sp. LWH13-1.2]|uniref:ice-binding family protein n=1 Tax=Microbacterium sp. LWH13-1.2 TaxID=3135260 RepID=UPI00313A3C44
MLRTRALLCTIAVAAFLTLAVVPPATAATTIDGPIDLGTAAPFAVLASSTVTNTGPSVIGGDVGLSPGTSITGIPPAVVNGTVHATDAVAAEAQADLTTAYGVAAGLTPMASGLGDLTGASLTPGVYAGDTLSVTGQLTLAGTAESVWIFQAASTLTIGSGAIVTVTGGASACNVFWQVGSSATIGSGAQFVGTVMADISVTAQTAATITGRLLARTGAVTLDTDTLTAPTGCTTTPGTVTTSPEVTSASPPTGRVGVDYSHTITAEGAPQPEYSVVGGALPPGLVLDAVTGIISGQPTVAGAYLFTIRASNGASPDADASYEITIAPAVAPAAENDGGAVDSAGELAESGLDSGPASLAIAVAFLVCGGVLTVVRRIPGRRSASIPR